MPAQKRHKTDYAGVYFIWGTHRVTHKPEKIFYITYRKNGKVVDEKVGRASEDMTPARASNRRALRMAGKEATNAEKRAAEKAAKEAEAGRWTIAKLWDLYCENSPGNKTLKNEKNKFDLYLKDGIGKKEPGELVPLDGDRLRISLQKAGKNTTAARVLELFRRTINYGVNRGLISPITFKIKIPKLNNQTTEDLSPEQLGKLLAVLDADEDQTAANVMRLALFTGMRRTEIFKLRWDDIDFRRGFITLQDPKGGSDQTIPINDSTKRIFESISKNEDSPFIFPGRKMGSHLTDCKKSFRRIAETAELPEGFRPLHGLRHVYASMLASSGKVDMYTLQKLLTHKTPQMTQRYAHLRDEALKKASDLAGDLINEAIEENAKDTEGKRKPVDLKDRNNKA
ncbi:MAG: site-specific integrase [Syntrophaceae bacterium]|nr:site-specific integrase [Syntrophaceae bacterium]